MFSWVNKQLSHPSFTPRRTTASLTSCCLCLHVTCTDVRWNPCFRIVNSVIAYHVASMNYASAVLWVGFYGILQIFSEEILAPLSVTLTIFNHWLLTAVLNRSLRLCPVESQVNKKQWFAIVSASIFSTLHYITLLQLYVDDTRPSKWK